MSVLIIYQSVEGQTRKIARFARDIVQKAGGEVVLFDAADKTAQLSLEGVDKVILAAPVHERRHPREFELLLSASKDDLMARPSLLLSVSLSAAFPEGHEEAKEYLTEMEMRTGFKPGAEALIAGAVRTERYDYFATQVIRHVVLRGRDYDPDQGAHEFTDWNALENTLREFLDARPA
ncbi:protoporphyrinogen oxidase [Maritimibacter sp. 55A14]|uniref:flavodoxin domain-containing protein n=1 Tax=Maritimibacter sp. 55A14 TaxID=2174844 RepID=UPI000D60E4D8|nr:flavodoxin domain-containing protein [Maritimibacter sp. 55A14]PWE33375.1 protoporphyrinogen oxidase [Maritimibacter sp. 55A14]